MIIRSRRLSSLVGGVAIIGVAMLVSPLAHAQNTHARAPHTAASHPAVAQTGARPGPIVVVVDAARARIATDRLMHALGDDLGRDVVRITDARARDASGTLTLAYEGANRWLIRYDSRGRGAERRERITPGQMYLMLADIASNVVSSVEHGGGASTEIVTRVDENELYIAWADEILDPFAGLPSPSRREVAIYSEVIDPFAPAAARRGGWTEVLDPWSR